MSAESLTQPCSLCGERITGGTGIVQSVRSASAFSVASQWLKWSVRLNVARACSAMFNALPRKNDRILGTTSYSSFERNFHYVRKRTATKLQNPRLLHIHFHTLRHWKASMEYHKTKDILHFMKLLGHKRIDNTLIYTQLITFEKDDFHSAVANTIKEAKGLIEQGFEYVCTQRNDAVQKAKVAKIST